MNTFFRKPEVFHTFQTHQHEPILLLSQLYVHTLHFSHLWNKINTDPSHALWFCNRVQCKLAQFQSILREKLCENIYHV